MKLLIPTVCAVVIICGFLFQRQLKTSSESKSDSAPPPMGTTAPLKRKSLMEARSEQRGEEKRRRSADLDEVMARNAKAMTPKLKAMMVNRQMEVWGPKYQQLFGAWELDADTQANLLDVVRQREERLFDLHQKHRAEGMASIKQFGEDYKVEKMLAEVQFDLLVGEKRGAEIRALEASLQTSAQQEATRIVDLQLLGPK